MSRAAARFALTTTFSLAACGDAEPLAHAPLLAQEEGAVADVPHEVSGNAGAAPRRCSLPPDCTRIVTIGFQLDACCTESLACGLDLTPMVEQASLLDPEIRRQVFPPELAPGHACLHPSRMFVPVEGPPEERIKVRGAADILLTPACSTYNMFSFPLPGCCLPTGKCGMSSHFSISNVIPFVAPGSEAATPQCLSPAELRRQLKGSALERIGDPPEITATCDYAALDARLPPGPERPPDDQPPEDRP